MYLKINIRIAGLVTILLPLSTFAQEAETEQVIVIGNTETVHSDAWPPPTGEEVITKSVGVITKVVEEEYLSERDETGFKGFFENFSINIEEQLTRLQKQFENSDENGDGYLELNELSTTQSKSAFPTVQTIVSPHNDYDGSTKHRVEWVSHKVNDRGNEEEPQQIKDAWEHQSSSDFDEADVDGDGLLTRSEFLSRHDRWNERATRDELERLDSNQDRYVDFFEYSKQIEIYRQLDRDQDGIVTADELGFKMPAE